VDHLVEMSDVAHHGVRFEPLGMQVRHCPFKTGLVDVGKHDSRPTTGELGRGGESDAVRAAGDNGALTFETVHGATVTDRSRRASRRVT
jgi:hypothetical protein